MMSEVAVLEKNEYGKDGLELSSFSLTYLSLFLSVCLAFCQSVCLPYPSTPL